MISYLVLDRALDVPAEYLVNSERSAIDSDPNDMNRTLDRVEIVRMDADRYVVRPVHKDVDRPVTYSIECTDTSLAMRAAVCMAEGWFWTQPHEKLTDVNGHTYWHSDVRNVLGRSLSDDLRALGY